MNIRNRILLGPVVAIVLLIVFGIVAYQAISAQGRALQEINDVRFEHYRQSTLLADRVSRTHLGMFRLVTWFTAYDQATQDKLIDEVNRGLTGIDQELQRWSSDERVVAEEKQRLGELRSLLGKYKQSAEAAVFMVKIDVTSALGDMKTVEASYQALAAAFAELNNLEQRLAAETYTAAQAASRRALVFNLTLLCAAIAIAAAIGLTTARRLIRQLGGEPADAVEVAGRIAAGDLTVRVPMAPQGSLMAAMEDMRNGLREMIGQMNQHSADLSSAAAQLAGAARHVAQSSVEQNDAAAAMAASIEQMSVSIGSVADNSQQAASLSTASGDTAQSGAEVILGASLEMETIASSVNQVATSLEQLGAQAAQISTVVTVIRDVAEQTNLLALNASIEAARAGESGRGFAVVADEVRKLAERTAKATQEITSLVEGIESGAERAVSTMRHGVEQVGEGMLQANQASAAMQQIRLQVDEVVDVVGNISCSLEDQDATSGAISRGVEQIARMAEDNNGSVATLAETARKMRDLSSELKAQVQKFRVSV